MGSGIWSDSKEPGEPTEFGAPGYTLCSIYPTRETMGIVYTKGPSGRCESPLPMHLAIAKFHNDRANGLCPRAISGSFVFWLVQASQHIQFISLFRFCLIKPESHTRCVVPRSGLYDPSQTSPSKGPPSHVESRVRPLPMFLLGVVVPGLGLRVTTLPLQSANLVVVYPMIPCGYSGGISSNSCL